MRGHHRGVHLLGPVPAAPADPSLGEARRPRRCPRARRTSPVISPIAGAGRTPRPAPVLVELERLQVGVAVRGVVHRRLRRRVRPDQVVRDPAGPPGPAGSRGAARRPPPRPRPSRRPRTAAATAGRSRPPAAPMARANASPGPPASVSPSRIVRPSAASSAATARSSAVPGAAASSGRDRPGSRPGPCPGCPAATATARRSRPGRRACRATRCTSRRSPAFGLAQPGRHVVGQPVPGRGDGRPRPPPRPARARPRRRRRSPSRGRAAGSARLIFLLASGVRGRSTGFCRPPGGRMARCDAVPGRGRRPARAEARRGRPDRHAADPAARAGSARSARGCAGRRPASAPGWSRSATSTCSSTTGRSLDIVTQAETLGAYGKDIVGDYGRYTAGTAVLETAERLTAEEREPALRLFLLVVGALRGLADRRARPVAGARRVPGPGDVGRPAGSRRCRSARAAAAPGPHRAFSVPAGGAVCADCRPAGSSTPDAESVALVVALLSGDWATAEAAASAARREASGLVAAHLQWHLERGLRSLPAGRAGRGAS